MLLAKSSEISQDGQRSLQYWPRGHTAWCQPGNFIVQLKDRLGSDSGSVGWVVRTVRCLYSPIEKTQFEKLQVVTNPRIVIRLIISTDQSKNGNFKLSKVSRTVTAIKSNFSIKFINTFWPIFLLHPSWNSTLFDIPPMPLRYSTCSTVTTRHNHKVPHNLKFNPLWNNNETPPLTIFHRSHLDITLLLYVIITTFHPWCGHQEISHITIFN